MPTHYEVLEIDESADQAEVRQAYYRAARRWHPDGFAETRGDDAERAETEMRRINEAWEVLGEVTKRRRYDLQLAGGGSDQNRSQAGVRTDDGVFRIDPRFLDPEFVEARRHAQYDEISNRTSVILRMVPLVALLGVLIGIFVFTAYARNNVDTTVTTLPGPNLGAGIEANDCVDVLVGPSLLRRPCDANADGRVVGARLPGGICPPAAVFEVELSNGAIVCLGAVQ